jgi:anti-anti-sigma factor
VEAKFEIHSGVYVVQLSGQLDFESADALKARCASLFANKNIVFSLKGLSFVGSSGLTPFLELLRALLKSNGTNFKICSVSSEFMRLFEAAELFGLEVYENAEQAQLAFQYANMQKASTESAASNNTNVEAQNIQRMGTIGLDINIIDDEDDDDSDLALAADAPNDLDKI